MRRRMFLLAMAAVGLVALSACGGTGRGTEAGSGAVQSAGSATEDGGGGSAEAPPEAVTDAERARELVQSLSLEEKVGQLFFVRTPESGAAEDAAAYHLGGYILFGRDFQGRTADEVIQAVRRCQEAAEIPLLIGADEEGGSVVRASANPCLRAERFRSPQQLFRAGGLEAVTAECHEKDAFLKALGVNVNLAPVADVSTRPGDFIYERSFGQDAQGTAQYVSAAAAQMLEDNMGCVLKHFPGYGDNADTHTGAAVDRRPMEQFEDSDFLPFAAGFAASRRDGRTACAVLVSHNLVACMDAELPASLSPAVHKLLRDKLGFDGVAMTDDLVMDAVKSYARDGSAAVLAVLAGNDLLVATDYREQIPQVLAAAEDGTIPAARLDEAAERVLVWKMQLGLL